MTTIASTIARLAPRRRIHGITAVLLPFDGAGRILWSEFERHLTLTVDAGIEPAVNMDTGFGPQLTPAERREVLRRTRALIGDKPFVAGAGPFNDGADLMGAYRRAVADIVAVGATPIVFQSPLFTGADGARVAELYRAIVDGAPRALAFELGPMFAPFGRIYDRDTFRRILDIPAIVGAKHSSLDRREELERLALRDAHRPDFKVYTGNDLAIDLVMYGSDYLLGLSTFDPQAFALRDRWWAEGDARFYQLNDALQWLGMVAFRAPVPAYKHSAAVYLELTGRMAAPQPHPSCPRRPAWEREMLAPIADLIASAVAAAPSGRAATAP
ncbi:MAG TPA: dihydrodipicolinate synthase family protein [Planctomycetota bacterium]|nr:dihydrodipicolinate synthase family protein [Planctomycetota bacterium]